MSNYISHFIPAIGTQNIESVQEIEKLQGKAPILKYVAVVNPTFSIRDVEAEEELYKQVISFSLENGSGLSNNADDFEQLKTIGLIRGIDSFAKNFTTNEDTEATIIKTSGSISMIKKIEGNYYIACSLQLQKSEEKCNVISNQMQFLINEAYRNFVMLNTPFANILETYNLEVLRSTLSEYWCAFISAYNKNKLSSPQVLNWPCSLNYKGLMGLLPADSNKPIYKKSSISLNYNIKCEIDQIFEFSKSDEHMLPNGLIISCFNKEKPKNYGMIHMKSIKDEQAGFEKIPQESLIDIYNYLESFEYHDKLDANNLTKPENSHFFPSFVEDIISINNNELSTHKPSSEADSRSITSAATTAATAFDMINPLTLTNNLVISPLNYTMNSVMNLSIPYRSNSSAEENSNNSWLHVPSIFQRNTTTETTPIEVVQENQVEDLEGQDSDQGLFLIGPTVDAFTGSEIIQRKIVYLKMRFKDANGEIKEEYRENLIVVFQKNNICIALIYDSSNAELDKLSMYKELSDKILLPLIEEINLEMSSGSQLGNTIESLRSLDGMIQQKTLSTAVDQDFFFLVYDRSGMYFKTSLPYLPNTNDYTEDSISKSVTTKTNNAIFYLHDHLIDIFISQKNVGFFQKCNSMNEYFHKFNSNKSNDLMFYYIKHEEKFIIIVKNRNYSQKTAGSTRRSTVARMPNFQIPTTSLAANRDDDGILNQIADGVYDYAHLGFLDNLGEDVKAWLEGFSFTGDT